MHVDAEHLQQLLDGEMDPSEAVRLRHHLAECPHCSARFERVSVEQAEVDALLAHLDRPVPHVDPEDLMRSGEGGRTRRRLAQAALVVLGLGVAGAAWAAPGSPLPGWLASLRNRATGTEGPGAAVPEALSTAGVQVTRDSVVIEFVSHAVGGEVGIHLIQDSLLVVRTLRGTGSFSDEDDGHRIVVDPRGENTDYRIDVPQRARRVEIRVGGTRVFLKDESDLSVSVDADSLGVWTVPLGPGGG